MMKKLLSVVFGLSLSASLVAAPPPKVGDDPEHRPTSAHCKKDPHNCH